MAHPYRIFFLDAHGHIERAEVISALDDMMAMTTTRILAGDNGAELWDGDRVVGKVAVSTKGEPEPLRSSN